MTRSISAVCLAMCVAVPAVAFAQVEVDRSLSRVAGTVITQSDVQQAQRMKLVGDTSSDAATLRGLENRLLILVEAQRSPAVDVTDDAVAARRREWAASVGPEIASLKGGTMTEQALIAWCKDDVRVQAFMDRRFANVNGAEREKAISDWIGRLRQRAGLRIP